MKHSIKSCSSLLFKRKEESMKLENLHADFGVAQPEEQALMLSAYRLRRAEDMQKPGRVWRKPVETASKPPAFTTEEKAVMKMLGLKQKDMLALRSVAAVEVVDTPQEVTEEDTKLFFDGTFDESEEA
jgi:hypothetical protein